MYWLILVLVCLGKLSALEEEHTKPYLFDLKGVYSNPISSKSDLTKKYFDQGMVFYYGFNFAEAARSFQEAANLDPNCAICYFGKALALKASTTFTDLSQDPKMMLAVKSIQRALNLRDYASPKEKSYIDALAESLKNTQSFAAINQAFLFGMQKIAKDYPDDLDAKTLLAKAAMDASGNENEAIALKNLQDVLAKDPNHPGANHYYIHAVEGAANFKEGLKSAKRLEDLIPFAGHLLHMPAHIYFRLGLYSQAAIANEKAIKADDDLFSKNGLKGDYFASYYLHNFQFLIAAYVLDGEKLKALETADKAQNIIKHEKLNQSDFNINVLEAERVLILLRFKDFEQILKEEKPQSPYALGMWHFARALSFLHFDQIEKAKSEALSIENHPVDKQNDILNVFLKVASLNAKAVIEEHLGNENQMLEDYRKAIELESTVETLSPPVWYQSSREALRDALKRKEASP